MASLNAQPAPFLRKTYDIVDEKSSNSIVSWASNGNSFVVWKPAEFARDLLPKFFKHNNFSSFVRQLNTYGFRKIDTDAWEFANECFTRHDREALTQIQRRKAASPTSKGLARLSSQTIRKHISAVAIQPAGSQATTPAVPGSMHDYSSPMHAAAADLLAFTGNPGITHRPSPALMTSSYESSPATSDALQALNPPGCYHEALPTHFLPLNLHPAKQPPSQQGAPQGTARHAQGQSANPPPSGAPQPVPAQGGGPPHPGVAPDHHHQASDGLPAVERYSKMVANVLQPSRPQPACQQDAARDLSNNMDATLLALHASSGTSNSSSSGLAVSTATGQAEAAGFHQLEQGWAAKRRKLDLPQAETAADKEPLASTAALPAGEVQDISKPVPTNLHDVTHSVLAQMAAQLKQLTQMSHDVEGLKAGQAQTTNGLTYLAQTFAALGGRAGGQPNAAGQSSPQRPSDTNTVHASEEGARHGADGTPSAHLQQSAQDRLNASMLMRLAALEQQANAAQIREAALLRRVAWLEAHAAARQGPTAEGMAPQHNSNGIRHRPATLPTLIQPASSGVLPDNAAQAPGPQDNIHAEEMHSEHVLDHRLRVKEDIAAQVMSAHQESSAKGLQTGASPQPLESASAATQDLGTASAPTQALGTASAPTQAPATAPAATQASGLRDKDHEQRPQGPGTETGTSWERLQSFAAGEDPQLQLEREGLPAVRTRTKPAECLDRDAARPGPAPQGSHSQSPALDHSSDSHASHSDPESCIAPEVQSPVQSGRQQAEVQSCPDQAQGEAAGQQHKPGQGSSVEKQQQTRCHDTQSLQDTGLQESQPPATLRVVQGMLQTPRGEADGIGCIAAPERLKEELSARHDAHTVAEGTSPCHVLPAQSVQGVESNSRVQTIVR